MKKTILLLIAITIITACKKEKENEIKNTFDVSSVKSCDDILNLYDKGIKVYKQAYIKYLNDLNDYKQANPNINIIDNSGKIPEGYKKIMQKMENRVSGFNLATKDEEIVNLYKKCSSDEGFTKKIQEKITELQTQLKKETPEEFHILIDFSLEKHIKDAMF